MFMISRNTLKRQGCQLDFRRGESLYLREALKIFFVERQYIGDPVNIHHRNQARVMNDDSLYSVIDDQSSLFLMGCKILREEAAKALDHFGLSLRLYR
ncbi:MAG: hypothetical protein ACK562_08490 [Acidobacteriota bacterium]